MKNTHIKSRAPSPISSAASFLAVKKDRQSTFEMNLLMQDWRVVKSVISRLGRHYGDAFVVGEHTAVTLVIGHALTQYSWARVTPTGKLPDIERLAVFMIALLDKACEVLPAKVTDKVTGQWWCPSDTISYPAWYGQVCADRSPEVAVHGLELCYAQTEDEHKQLRLNMLDAIGSDQLKELLENSQRWEQV